MYMVQVFACMEAVVWMYMASLVSEQQVMVVEVQAMLQVEDPVGAIGEDITVPAGALASMLM